MNCFEQAGIRRTSTLTAAQIAAGGKACVCGKLVRFDIAVRRAEHFLECPVVDARVNAGIDGIEIDEDAVRVGMAVFGAQHQG